MFSKPCGAILAALRDVILKMETNFRDGRLTTKGCIWLATIAQSSPAGVSEPPGEPEPEQEMDPTGQGPVQHRVDEVLRREFVMQVTVNALGSC